MKRTLVAIGLRIYNWLTCPEWCPDLDISGKCQMPRWHEERYHRAGPRSWS